MRSVVLRRQRLGEDYGLAGAQPLRSPILDESECLDESSRFTAVPKLSGSCGECDDHFELGPNAFVGLGDRLLGLDRRRLGVIVVFRSAKTLVLLEISRHLSEELSAVVRDGMTASGQSIAQPLRHTVEAYSQRGQRRRHSAMEADKKKMALLSPERVEVLAHQPRGDVGVQRLLLGAHRVLEHARVALDERHLEKLLRLTPKRPLKHRLQAASEFPHLFGEHRTIACLAEQLTERGQAAEKRTSRLDVLHQAPQLRERVLDRRGCQQDDRRIASFDHFSQAPRGLRMLRVLVVGAVLVVALVDA